MNFMHEAQYTVITLIRKCIWIQVVLSRANMLFTRSSTSSGRTPTKGYDSFLIFSPLFPRPPTVLVHIHTFIKSRQEISEPALLVFFCYFQQDDFDMLLRIHSAPAFFIVTRLPYVLCALLLASSSCGKGRCYGQAAVLQSLQEIHLSENGPYFSNHVAQYLTPNS